MTSSPYYYPHMQRNHLQRNQLKRIGVVCTLFILALSLGGCLRAYRPDMQQGTIVTQEMLEALESGMSRREVRFTLGSPMIEDPFHANRWDYVYSLREGRSNNRRQLIVTVVFEDDRLSRVEGDAELKDIADGKSNKNPLRKAQVSARNFWDRLFKKRQSK